MQQAHLWVLHLPHLPNVNYDEAWLLVWLLQVCKFTSADLAAPAKQPRPVLQRHANHMFLDPAHSTCNCAQLRLCH